MQIRVKFPGCVTVSVLSNTSEMRKHAAGWHKEHRIGQNIKQVEEDITIRDQQD